MDIQAIKDVVARLSPEDQAELDELLMYDAALWVPLPGPQTKAYDSRADIVGYGGAAGGGKTDLACGLCLTRHQRSIIYRREGVQITGILLRLEEILGTTEGHNSQKKIWRLPGRIMEYGGVPNPGDEKKYQGRPHDLKVFDEVTEFLEHQVRFLMGWLRSSDPSIKCQVLMTFNPPTTAEGRWVLDYFGPWLRKDHPNPAKHGELRWFTTDPDTGEDMECDGPDPIEIDGETVQPLSRTFIPAKVEDNPFYMASGYKAVLQSLPEPLRSQMLKGDFMAGVSDDPFQIIPTSWVDAAVDRWKIKSAKADFKKGRMDSLGVDVARGGADKTVLSPRHGTFFDELLAIPGVDTPDGPTVASHVVKMRRDQSPVHIDIIGWGSSAYDFLVDGGVQTIGINGANKSFGVTTQGALEFFNLRAEIWWYMREALDPVNGDEICLPPDKELQSDLCAPKWEYRKGGIKVESKDEVIKRLGRSPDKADAVVMSNIDTLRDADNDMLTGGKQSFCNGGKEYDPYG